MKKLILLLSLLSCSVFGQNVKLNPFTTNTAPTVTNIVLSIAPASTGIQTNNGTGTNNVLVNLVVTNIPGTAPLTVQTTNGQAILSTAGNWKVAAPGKATEINYGIRGNLTNGLYLPLDNAVAIANNGTNAVIWQDGGQTNAGPISAIKFIGSGAGLTGIPLSGVNLSTNALVQTNDTRAIKLTGGSVYSNTVAAFAGSIMNFWDSGNSAWIGITPGNNSLNVTAGDDFFLSGGGTFHGSGAALTSIPLSGINLSTNALVQTNDLRALVFGSTVTGTNGYSSDLTHFLKPPTNTAVNGFVVQATGTAGDSAWVATQGVTIPNTITPTNFVLNTVYTNTSGSVQLIDVSGRLVVAAVNGNASLDLMVDQAGGTAFALQDRLGMSTLVTSIGMNYTNNLAGAISNAATYYFTNTSAGSGNSASIVPGTGEAVTLSDGAAAGVATTGGNNTFTGNNTFNPAIPLSSVAQSGNIVTQNNSFALTVSNNVTVDAAHSLTVTTLNATTMNVNNMTVTNLITATNLSVVNGLTNLALTASRIALTDANKALTSAAASGAVPIDADGSATTSAQINARFPGDIITNNYGSAAVVISNNLSVDAAHQFTGNGAGITNLAAEYDPNDVSVAIINEEFYNTSVNASQIGAYGWQNAAINAGTLVANVASTTGHPGVITISTTSSGGSGYYLVLGDTGNPTKKQFDSLNTVVPWAFTVIFKTGTSNGVAWEAGLTGSSLSATNASTTGVLVNFDPVLSQDLRLVTGDGTLAFSSIVTGMQTNTWYVVKVQSQVAGQVYANANGGAYVTNTTHCPSGQVLPVFRIAAQGASGPSTWTIDAWKGKFTLPARYP